MSGGLDGYVIHLSPFAPTGPPEAVGSSANYARS